MIKLAPAIVVEGKYDKAKLARIFDTEIIEVSGFGLFKDEKMIALLRKTAKTRGIVILTDPDGAGLVIRNRIKGSVTDGKVYNAYIPDIKGKEGRKRKPSKEGLLGVEGVSDDLILAAVKNCGAMEDKEVFGKRLTKKDLFDLGLSGASDSKKRRKELCQKLFLPENISANALLTAINASFTDEEIKTLCGK